MTDIARRLGIALFAITALVLGLLVALLYLDIGYFQVYVLLLGAALAVLLTRPQWRAARPPIAAAAAAVAAYAGITAVVWTTLLGQTSHQVFAMRWESRGTANTHGATEVVLHFVAFPGHRVGEYSDDLYAYLAGQPDNPVPVTFEITNDLFKCVRGFQVTQVGELRSWRSLWGYSGSDGREPSPWDNPWWCP
ncbi:MAG: hypothetical protein OEW56_09055 [Gemmatimonadota bacterium]|nr:hypothetical protein [Gemmatimonadota bacterium]